MADNKLLEQLAPLATPEPINGLWPLAPGWYLLGALLLATLFIGYPLLKKRKKRVAERAYRKQALKEINRLWLQYQKNQNPLTFVEQSNQLLKRTAMQAYPNDLIAPMNGPQWWQFLHSCYPSGQYREAEQVESFRYQPDFAHDPAPLYEYCKQWITHHDS
ncbi:DUF4381 domain-containing protein [Aestuariirhabdus sp. LZHN29]|uniref:DUF4381 domain-containing protein n=1 Tax=Aestuariirhabdus sp. LZHN29 TaxID=3417462 RepID=UPI003CF86ABA